MKKLSLGKIAATVIIGLALSVPAHPGSDKYSRSVRVLSEQSVQPVEVWMLDRDYLIKESAEAIEPWMLEPGYLNEEAQLLESWMFAESHLSEENIPCEPESWMFDADYLKNKVVKDEAIRK